MPIIKMDLLDLPVEVLLHVAGFCDESSLSRLREINAFREYMGPHLDKLLLTKRENTLIYWIRIQKDEIKKRLEDEIMYVMKRMMNPGNNTHYHECIRFNENLINECDDLLLEQVLDKNYHQAELWRRTNFELYYNKTNLLEYGMME